MSRRGPGSGLRRTPQAIKDALDGLRVCDEAPAEQFWSVLVYDLNTGAFVEHMPKAGVSSLDEGLKTNSDGSVDVHFGPKAPAGLEANWAPTIADRDYSLLFRFYGPSEAPFDKSWALNDLVKTE